MFLHVIHEMSQKSKFLGNIPGFLGLVELVEELLAFPVYVLQAAANDLMLE